MSLESKSIIPGKGLGELTFGMSRDQVKAKLGAPNDVDKYAYEDDEGNDVQTESWHYDEMEMSMSFDESDDWKLGTFSVSSADFTLNGHRLIGLVHDDFMETIEEMSLGEYEIEDMSMGEGEDHVVISFDELTLNFWFDGGYLKEIQWGPLFDDNDELIWP